MKRKMTVIDYIFISVFIAICGYFGYLFSYALHESNRNISKLFSILLKTIKTSVKMPFTLKYFNSYTIVSMLFWMIFGALVIFLVYMGGKNFMFGKEYGTARWENVRELNKKLDNNYNKVNPKLRDDNIIVLEQWRPAPLRNKKIEINTYNMRLSQNLNLSLDSKFTDLNNNVLIVGGSGKGKSFKFVKPNFMSLSTSFITTDPKGELARDTCGFFKYFKYNVEVIDLRDSDGFKKSTKYNPFAYVKDALDIRKLITNLISNTTEVSSNAADPFWEKAEGMYLQAIFNYVWMIGVECERTNRIEHNMWAVMYLVNKTIIKEDARGQRVDCIVDTMFKRLEMEDENNPAVTFYNNAMSGAADTVRSIVISAKARLAPLDNPALLDFMWEDELNIENWGLEKTAVYLVTPDNDTTYNCIVGLLYTQAFQVLYKLADKEFEGALPVHVRFMLDEFANVALPKEFINLLSTMRSRFISSTIIIQAVSQIKGLFPKQNDYETLMGNCDTLIYLGGNEQSTHKLMSEMLGKMTIDKRSSSDTRGQNHSFGQNEDILGRELMFADEVRKMKNDECIILIAGHNPVKDKKVRTLREPLWKIMVKTGKDFRFDARIERHNKKLAKENGFLSDSEIKLKKIKDQRKKEKIDYEKKVAKITGESFAEEYKDSVIDLSLADIFALSELSQEDIDTHISNKVLNKDAIKKNAERDEIRFKEKIKETKKTMEDKKLNTVNIKEFSTAEQAETYLLLDKNGFSAMQINSIIRLANIPERYPPEYIASLFTPNQDVDKINILVNTLLQNVS